MNLVYRNDHRAASKPCSSVVNSVTERGADGVGPVVTLARGDMSHDFGSGGGAAHGCPWAVSQCERGTPSFSRVTGSMTENT